MGKKTFMKKLPLLSSICWREIFFHLVHLAHTAFSFINYFIDFITCEIDLRGPSGWNLVKLKNFSPQFFFGKIFTWLYLDFEYVACFYINYFAESKSGLLWTLFFRCHGNQFKTRAFFPNYFWGVNAVPRSWVWKQTVVHSRFLEVTFEAWLLSYKEL